MKRGRGRWEVKFQRQRPRATKRQVARAPADQLELVAALVERAIGPATAEELATTAPAASVRLMTALFDWYAARGEPKGPGFLVDSIRNPQKYRVPPELRTSARSIARRPEHVVRQATSQATATVTEPNLPDDGRRFNEFWKRLGPDRRREFETAALAAAPAVKREGYLRTRAGGGPAFDEYRQLILRDHFARTRKPTSAR